MADGSPIVRPPGWPRPSGYADAVSAHGRTIYVSGQVGWDPLTHEIVSDDFAQQVRRALQNVVTILLAAGGRPEHVARMTWYITDREAYLAARKELREIWRELFGAHYPATSIVEVSGLLAEGAKVEIEATAVLPNR